jgi:IS5 family transposase
LDGDIAQAFFLEVRAEARAAGLLSDEHFTVDGTLLEAWASQKSFRPKDRPDSPSDDPTSRNPTVNFRGERRANDTHQSTTDPDARLYKKAAGQEAKLAYLGHVLTENRHGLIIDALVTHATGTAERTAASAMVAHLPEPRRVTVGGDKNYDTKGFVQELRGMGVTPHVAQYAKTAHRGSAIDARTTRHPGYAVSQQKRKLVEQCFGWMKTVGVLRKLRHRGRARVNWTFIFAAAAFNLVRMRTLLAQPA